MPPPITGEYETIDEQDTEEAYEALWTVLKHLPLYGSVLEEIVALKSRPVYYIRVTEALIPTSELEHLRLTVL